MTTDEATSAAVTLSPAKTIQKCYSIFDGANLSAAKKIKVSRLKQKAQDHIYRKMIVGAVSKYGGPCKSKQDVERLLTKLEGASHAHIREVIRCELNYQKSILGSRDKKLTQHRVLFEWHGFYAEGRPTKWEGYSYITNWECAWSHRDSRDPDWNIIPRPPKHRQWSANSTKA